MPAITRLGHYCTGHGCWPSRPNDEASTTVFVNGIGVHRETDHWITHCCVSCHDGVLSSGSSSIYINGLQCARIGDPISCGSFVLEGSENTFAGD